MSLLDKLRIIRDTLTAVSQNVYHYTRPKDPNGSFIVWQEDGEDGSFHAENHIAEQVIHGTIDLFTKDEFDKLIDDVQTVLNAVGRIQFRLATITYETDSTYIHYEWEFWVI